MMEKYLKIKILYFKTCSRAPSWRQNWATLVLRVLSITLHGEQSPPSSRSATKSSENSSGREKSTSSRVDIFALTWSRKKFLVSRIMYSSRSLHFWGFPKRLNPKTTLISRCGELRIWETQLCGFFCKFFVFVDSRYVYQPLTSKFTRIPPP